MAFELQAINAAASADPAKFIADCDALYNERIADAARRIIDNLPESPIVLLSGPSGSGKTTTAMRIRDELRARGVQSHSIAMDNYFKTVTPTSTPRTASGDYDLESPLCLDMELLNEHFTLLSRGERIFIPKYEFARRMRVIEPSMSLRLGQNEVAIFEGIHALNSRITDVHPEAFKLYISARSNTTNGGESYVFKGTWLRMVRRIVRDSLFRGADPTETMAMWANVREGEKKYITPFKMKADLQLDTAFPYECCVMRTAALPMLQGVPEGIDRREEICAVAPALERFVPIDTKYLAPNALLREFLGGGVYQY